MQPIVTPDEMRAIDAAAPEPLDVLVARAGTAVAREAERLLGGVYGRTVNVIAGTGNNGADGRVAADRLRQRGVRVRLFEAAGCPASLPPADLVIDAAYGTGFRGEWIAPAVGDAAVLAVDVPSGLDALTGAAGPGVLRADRTLTFQALKPGLLLGAGPGLAGDIVVADIGLDVSTATRFLVEAADAGGWWPRRRTDSHKWRAAVKAVAGSSDMPGAARLTTSAALRAGAGIVSLVSPRPTEGAPIPVDAEVIATAAPPDGLAAAALADLGRFGSMIIGPGLGRDDGVLLAARACVADASVPIVIDGDGVFACAWSADGAGPLLRDRVRSTVVTPHDGEFTHLTGAAPGADRIEAARTAATDLDVVVLLKGPTTIVAAPPMDDEPAATYLVDVGDERLATPGSGDVLTGMIGAALAAGASAPVAAASAAYLHGLAGRLGPNEGLVAGDLVTLLPDAIAICRAAA